MEDKVPAVSSFSSSLALKAANLWEGRNMLKFKTFSDFDPFIKSNIFSTTVDVRDISKERFKGMEDELVKTFMEVCNIAQNQNSDDQSLWKSYKKKSGVDCYKRIASNNEKMIEMFKGRISIQCDFSRVFSVSNLIY